MAKLQRSDLHPDPFIQFDRWFSEAYSAGFVEPAAMTLATADSNGRPSARMVLLRGFDSTGFRFFTNYHSRKAVELNENPYASLVFYWDRLERQVRIETTVERLSTDESDDYFATRPHKNQLAAWASPQSQIIPDRQFLTTNMEKYRQEFDTFIPRPPGWGGYLARPFRFEFWQGRAGRLHDRFEYVQGSEGRWQIHRLGP
jgi:pyridoxamine 5'-phosphate oxidase